MNICSLYLYSKIFIMARPKRLRKISNPPKIRGLNPFGYYGKPTEPIQLFHEEYEAIKLLDYKNLNQVEAAKQMEVSRPTLTRIYESARKKMAIALTEARQILIEGGQAYYKDNWYECISCNSKFNAPITSDIGYCPICNNTNTINLNIKL